jgi:hypothetical protein
MAFAREPSCALRPDQGIVPDSDARGAQQLETVRVEGSGVRESLLARLARREASLGLLGA